MDPILNEHSLIQIALLSFRNEKNQRKIQNVQKNRKNIAQRNKNQQSKTVSQELPAKSVKRTYRLDERAEGARENLSDGQKKPENLTCVRLSGFLNALDSMPVGYVQDGTGLATITVDQDVLFYFSLFVSAD
ncbi:hypothetical protein YA0721_13920 [Pseudomonas carnis]|uniref:hypothetical protein n=1 Tax=Pseudomonas carnis TaxID=2487355 RepID=UPI0018E60242|nr:hypothetical protein [Pseudomonas carnis]MBI6655536.1 hypothetical protein [Pseudomonas carnis]MBI6662160.1 hypothetical protein [Pseudomonas carnis]MBI6689944.1 hypothetical protein [Pseudomonas carnis]